MIVAGQFVEDRHQDRNGRVQADVLQKARYAVVPKRLTGITAGAILLDDEEKFERKFKLPSNVLVDKIESKVEVAPLSTSFSAPCMSIFKKSILGRPIESSGIQSTETVSSISNLFGSGNLSKKGKLG